MRKNGAIAGNWVNDGWPALSYVESCFLDPVIREKNIAWGSDGGNLSVDGLYGTEGLPERGGLVTATLYIFMNAQFGASLQLTRWDGRTQKQTTHVSKGDLSRLDVFVFSKHETPLSVGLFIPFERAWLAVKEFMKTEGELPTAITWCDARDLPSGTWPDLADRELIKRLKLADPKDAITW